MKAVFKKTALERVHELLMDAERNQRTIDYLLLTPEEWYEIRADKWSIGALVDSITCYASNRISPESFRTVTLKSTDRRAGYPHRVFEVLPHYKLHGHDIVVAPAEYH